MFLLFLNTSQVNAQVVTNIEQGESPISAETVSTPDQSDDPRNIMNSESVDFNKETLQLHKRIAELEGLLSEANAMSSNIEGKLANMVKPELYDDAVRLLKEANAKISELEGKLATAVSQSLYDETVQNYRQKEAELTAANTKNLELEGKLASVENFKNNATLNIKNLHAQLTEANQKVIKLEANIASMRVQLADKDKQLLTLQTQAAAAVIKPQQRLTQYGKDPYAPDTQIGKKYYDDMMQTISSTCNPHPDQKQIKTSCILAEVDTTIRLSGR